MVKEELNKKVDELFQYRHIPELLHYSNIKGLDSFNNKLKKLQFAIYYLDHYLESNWKIRKTELNRFWKDIYQSLTEFGILKKDAPDLCKQIGKYQSHESNMRLGKWPTSYKFKYLYYYKSCDVKLMRRLIYMEAPQLKAKIKEPDWRYYDYITEINDDVQDVFEDMKTINGNRFLISILQTGSRNTQQEFISELRLLNKEINAHFKGKKKTEETQQLIKWTKTRLDETILLVKEQLSLKKIEQLPKSIISQYLTKQ